MVASWAANAGHRVVRMTQDFLFVRPLTAIINVCAVIISFGIIVGVWEFVRPDPIRSVSIISVQPANRVIDRAANAHLVIQRRVCMRRAASVRITRSWIDAAAGVTPTLDDWIQFRVGCEDRPTIHLAPPPSLNEGMHRYRAVLIACGWLRLACQEYQLEDVEVMIVGRPPIETRPPIGQRF